MFRKKYAPWIVAAVTLAILAVFLWSRTAQTATVDAPAAMGESKVEFGEFAEEYANFPAGYTLQVENGTDLTTDGVVFLEKANDDLYVQFTNRSQMDSEFVLKLFLDYSEVDFFVEGVSYSEYEFQLDNGAGVQIPIQIDSQIDLQTSHMLTVGVFAAPNKYASDLDLMSNSYGMVATFEIVSPGGSRTCDVQTQFEEPAKFLKSQFGGVMLNEDFAAEDTDQVLYPPKEVTLSPGEKKSFAYRIGNYSGEVLLIVLVDWKQIPLNGADYLAIENKPGYMGFGQVEITAPMEKGKYEVAAFAVEAPFEPRSVENFFSHDTAYRFTLSVQ